MSKVACHPPPVKIEKKHKNGLADSSSETVLIFLVR